MKKTSLMLIGVGAHARNVHIPFLSQLKNRIPFEFQLAIDIHEKIDEVKEWFNKQDLKPQKVASVKFFVHSMPSETASFLDRLVKENSINAVIISTPPYTHRAYALWALKHGLHILMDKPISTYLDASTSEEHAEAIYKDYMEIIERYKQLQKAKKTVFSINVKRRYHYGFLKSLSYIREISSRFGLPITSMHVYNSDGKWRLPHELILHNYHPYNTGYGAVSHSGYHLIDAAWWFLKNSYPETKLPERVEVFSSFVLPGALLHHLNRDEYAKIFGEEYGKFSIWPDQFLKMMTKQFGEVDAFITIRFLKENEVLTHVTLNIQHNTFSRRSWLKSNRDLLKGNGRVHQETFNIHQGPLQNIQIHSYHAYDKHTPKGSHFGVGGTQHFDIYRFLNIGITGGENPVKVETAGELTEESGIDVTLSQASKRAVLEEFLKLIDNPEKESVSSIESHEVPAHLMSAIYLSHIKQKNGEYPVVSFELNTNEVLS